VIKQREKEGNVEIYGVGIESESVKRYYKDWEVINHANELERALLNLIQNRIIK